MHYRVRRVRTKPAANACPIDFNGFRLRGVQTIAFFRELVCCVSNRSSAPIAIRIGPVECTLSHIQKRRRLIACSVVILHPE